MQKTPSREEEAIVKETGEFRMWCDGLWLCFRVPLLVMDSVRTQA